MGRLDQMQACLEFFSGATQPIPTDVYQVSQAAFPYGAWAIPGLQTVVKGELMETLDAYLPALWLHVPRGKEKRLMAQAKQVDYRISVYLEALLPGLSATGDGGPSAIATFYRLVDDLTALIRGSSSNEGPKQLITPSYPQGASMRFGEDIESEIGFTRQENTMRIYARLVVSSAEYVPNV